MHDQPRADRFEGPRFVLVSGSPTLVDSVRRRRRAAHLASTDRAGVHSRRLIRQRQHRIIRDRWYEFAGIVAVGAVVCLAVKLFVWEPVDAYQIGAIGASTLWAWHSIRARQRWTRPWSTGTAMPITPREQTGFD